MSRIETMFSRLKERGEKALIPYLPCGYPEPGSTPGLIRAIADAGADMIELGVPYADPLADGPVIQEASLQAVLGGTRLRDCLETVAGMRREGLKLPVALMGYANSFLAYGLEKLAHDAALAGVDGFIIPDLPSTMAAPWVDVFRPQGRDLIFFIAPTTTPERAQAVVEQGSGFLYCISVAGVTGERERMPEELERFLDEVRRRTELPLAVGFGISHAGHVEEVSRYADGAIVGSALVNLIRRTPADQVEAEVGRFIGELKQATGKAQHV
ncbi:Tryptophan synthase alpha chain [Paenibacillus pasadenensis]|uniref:Tryptophan synthase alpha chain n=1 Tax=Paenibacillus pasadenensis TaxID=217090 RepID=A0A2N5N2Y2_9BACL|nr:tryptophan synthase subunit alpha [Paenibacillus pasadenensis]PLT44683.1 Tryptophan synthase alpha chain [Paenibacillus pasadenensis]